MGFQWLECFLQEEDPPRFQVFHFGEEIFENINDCIADYQHFRETFEGDEPDCPLYLLIFIK